jgi:hypothetical protein
VKDEKEKCTTDKNNLNGNGIGHPTDNEQQKANEHGRPGFFSGGEIRNNWPSVQY